MDAKRTVLVALSGTQSQGSIIQKAVAMASRLDAMLIFLHVIETPLFDYLDFKNVIDPISVKKKLSEEVALYAAEVRTLVVVEFGTPSEVIVREAKRFEAMLIILGAKIYDPFAPHLGSTTKYILHHAPCSVNVIKNEKSYNDKVLVPVDITGGNTKERGFEPFIQGFSKQYLYVYEMPSELSLQYHDLSNHHFDQWEENIRMEVIKQKSSFESASMRGGIETVEVVSGIANGISEYAANHAFHLIAFHSRNLHGMSSIIFGSVASNVAKITHADLLISYG